MSDVAVRLGRGTMGERVVETAPPPATQVATVEVHADPRALIAEWRSLAASSPTPPYQMPDWLIPWTETVGAALDLRPMIVVARDADGVALALLPFGVTRQGGLSVATFLGGRDSNFNIGLFRRGSAWSRASLHDLLRRAALASRQRVDLYVLHNQPLSWEGCANPLAKLEHQPSPSFAYKAALTCDPEAFFNGHLSRESRKKLRQKMTRLRSFGEVEIIRAADPAQVSAVLDALLDQRRERCEALGLPTDDLAGIRCFLERVTAAGPKAPVELHGLLCGGRVVATLAGARQGSRFSGMMTSFASDPELARTSPGELLLAEVMRRACEEGLTTFDLGIGEARYKETYCPDVEPLFDSQVSVTLKGRIAAWGESIRLRAKRTIKQSSWAWPLVRRLRRLRGVVSGSLPNLAGAGKDRHGQHE